MTGIYLPLAVRAAPSAEEHFSFTAKLLERGDASVLVVMADGSLREIYAIGAEFSPVSDDGFVTVDMPRSRAVAEGIVA